MSQELLDRSTRDPRLEPAFAAIDDRSIDVLCLDVFDTLLLRRVPEPTDAFVVVGERLTAAGALAPFVTPTMFAAARAEAERRARARRRREGGIAEVQLSEVCAELPASMLRTTTAELVATELAVESDLVFANQPVVALAQHAQARDVRVVAASETYLSRDEIVTLLRAAGVDVLDATSVFTSSDHAAGKASGLYEVVVDAIGVDPGRVLHVGDKADADVTAARARGLRALHLPLRSTELDGVLERERRLLVDDVGVAGSFDPGLGDFGVSALRGTLEGSGPPPDVPSHAHQHWRTGATVLGPVLAGFADWVVDRAEERGVRRVGCLMREGNLLAPLVEQAARHRDSDVEAHPLWLSRVVCARAAIVHADYQELQIYVGRRIAPTVAELATALGLELADLGEHRANARARLDDPSLRDAVLGHIAGDPELRARIVESSAALRARVVRAVDHLRGDDDRVVLVDLGWHATTQRLLVRALRAEGSDVEIAGLYLVTSDRIVDAVLAGVDADAYLIRAGEPENAYAAILRSPEALEQLCIAAEGSAVDLADDGSPVHAPNLIGPEQLEQAAAGRRGVEDFARRWHELVGTDPADTRPVLVPRLRAVLRRFVDEPTAAEASAFGHWVHDDNFGAETTATLVHSDRLHDGAYLEDSMLGEVDALWPRALAAIDSDAEGARAAATSVSLYVDVGDGFDEARAVHRDVPANARGLSFTQLGIGARGIRRIRFDPAGVPSLVRIDRLALELRVRDRSDPVLLEFSSPAELEEWHVLDCSWLSGGLLVTASTDPQLILDLAPGLGDVYAVLASVAFAALELPDSALTPDGGLALSLPEQDRTGRGTLAELEALARDARRALDRRLRGTHGRG